MAQRTETHYWNYQAICARTQQRLRGLGACDDLSLKAVPSVSMKPPESERKRLKYRQIMGTKGVITDADFWASDFPLRAIVNGEMKDIPIETERHQVEGVDVLSRIVVHTDPQIVYENPFRTYPIDDWNVGTAKRS